MDPVILTGEPGQSITDPDMLHAIEPDASFDLDDLTMLIGSSESGDLLEIGLADAEGIDFIVPMPWRPDRSFWSDHAPSDPRHPRPRR